MLGYRSLIVMLLVLCACGASGVGAQRISQADYADREDFASLIDRASMYEKGRGVQIDLLKAYLWYQRAAEHGDREALLHVAILSAEKLSVAWPENVRNQLINSGQGKTSKIYTPPTTSALIEADEFLKTNRRIVERLIARNDAQRFSEATEAFEKAAAAGSVEALVRLGNLYLKQDWALSWRDLRQIKSDATSFQGSSSRAADLYRQAVAKGSNAARMNLAALYELGLGVKQDFSEAHDLYENAGSNYRGRAKLGLLRLSLNDIWQEQIWRRDDMIANAFQAKAEDNDIVIEPLSPLLRIAVRDDQGRRIFEGQLTTGQSYRPPRGRPGLSLWVLNGGKDNIRVSNGLKTVELPDELDFKRGIKLDHEALANGDFLIDGGDDYDAYPRYVSAASRKEARVILTPLAPSSLYVRNSDQTVGYFQGSDLDKRDRFFVPRQDDLVLELRAAGLKREKTSVVGVDLDGRRLFEVTAPPECLVTLDLSTQQLEKAMVVGNVPTSCEKMKYGDAPIPYIKSGDEVIGNVRRMPDEQIPGVIADFIPGIEDSIIWSMTNAGRYHDALAAQKIRVYKLLRAEGPNGLSSLGAEITLANLEVTTGAYGQAAKRLDDVVARLREVGDLPESTSAPLLLTLTKLLSTLGRSEEAGKLNNRGWALRERLNVESGHPPWLNTNAFVSQLTASGFDWREKTIASLLHGILLQQIGDPDEDDRYIKEFTGSDLTRLVLLIRDSGRHELFSQLLPLLHQQAKLNSGLSDESEPLKAPLSKPFRNDVFGGIERSSLLADGYTNYAEVLSLEGRHDEALVLLDQSERTTKTVFGQSSMAVSAVRTVIAREQLAAGHLSEGLDSARAAYRMATTFIDTRSAVSRKQSLDAAIRPAGLVLLDALDLARRASPGLEERLAAESFEVAQRMQYSAVARTMELLRLRLVQATAGMSDSERVRQDKMESLARLDKQLVAAISAREENAVAEIQRKITKFESELTQPSSGIPKSTFTAVSLAEMRNDSLLSENEALIGILSGNDATYVWLVTTTGIKWRKVAIGALELEDKVARLRCGLDSTEWRVVAPVAEASAGRKVAQAESKRRESRCEALTGLSAKPEGNLLPFDLTRSNELYRDLFGDFDTTLSDKSLLLVVSGPLSALPFNVLITVPPKMDEIRAHSYAAGSWLGMRNAITVLPGVSSLRLRTGARQSAATKKYIAFANPLLKGSDDDKPRYDMAISAATCVKASSICGAHWAAYRGETSGAPIDAETINRFSSLPQTACEVCGIAEHLGINQQERDQEIRLGARATETEVKRLGTRIGNQPSVLESYRYIHFATHGVLAGRLFPEPGLIFTPPDADKDRDNAIDDGFLSASEIADLKLDADWVILSACNTAGGSSIGAEPLSGLARAFFYAGARALLVSHWEIYTNAAVDLTTAMIGHVEEGVGRAEAMKLAQKELLAQADKANDAARMHPAYWGAFTIVGDGR